ncbi:DUF421 domain-containing protein [Paenalkalicoccus suaedae]|uniref:DUF421 domain-containing protein n=1 Tax=Paenalkalicoccus suaedae TaxID=2592382 RepID=A0A859FFG0_9BACI|nr:DUF421 domain-containing protein [Paenalkalicoccus suaedae]QKS71334.1 DUF421 domain-containing protein [Paenalkalicoccus suaedae]
MEFWTGAEDLPIWGFLIRAFIIYVYIFLVLKILGQRSLSAVNPIDFLFGVIIGDVVGEPLAAGDVALGGPLSAAGLIAFLHLSLSYISLKTPKFRRVVEDEPILLIQNGQILVKAMQKAKVTVESLLMDLRLQGSIDLNEIDYAVLEANGQISVIRYAENEPVQAGQLQVKVTKNGYPSIVIQDGRFIDANIEGKTTRNEIIKELKKQQIQSHKDVFLMTYNQAGDFYISVR